MDRLRNFAFLLKDISRLHARNFERLSSGLDLSLTQCKVLARLQRNEGLSQARLAEMADIDPMTLMRTIDRMEREGCVERRADLGDRRAYRLFLTPLAAPVLDRMWGIADVAREQSLAGLDAGEREQLLGLLERVHANLTTAVAAPEPDAAPATDDFEAVSPAVTKRAGRSKVKTS